MSNQKNALLIIDAQNDFCDPKGALCVPNANLDMQRVAKMITDNIDKIDYISMTQDTHHPLHVAHPAFWLDENGNIPNGYDFNQVTAADVKTGKWKPQLAQRQVLEYLEQLEANGEFCHTIWPEHCLSGTWGHGFVPDVIEAAYAWERQNKKTVNIVQKGEHPLREHFGIFRANVPLLNVASTQLNSALLNTFGNYERVFLMGQAKSHCVANSLRQICQDASTLCPKLFIVTDAMSDVPGLPAGFYDQVNKIYSDAKVMGVRECTTTNMAWV